MRQERQGSPAKGVFNGTGGGHAFGEPVFWSLRCCGHRMKDEGQLLAYTDRGSRIQTALSPFKGCRAGWCVHAAGPGSGCEHGEQSQWGAPRWGYSCPWHRATEEGMDPCRTCASACVHAGPGACLQQGDGLSRTCLHAQGHARAQPEQGFCEGTCPSAGKGHGLEEQAGCVTLFQGDQLPTPAACWSLSKHTANAVLGTGAERFQQSSPDTCLSSHHLAPLRYFCC